MKTSLRNRQQWYVLLQWPRMAAVALIRLYQNTLSPDHGPLKGLYPYGFCRHEPTCSEYGKQVIGERGVVIGALLTVKRIASCNPWKQPDPGRVMHVVHENDP